MAAVDIAGADTYNLGNEPQAEMYHKVQTIVDDKRILTYHECGVPPDPEKCKAQGVMWSWWMEWHTSHIASVNKDYLKYVYNHDLIVTLDEVPDIVAVYGKKK